MAERAVAEAVTRKLIEVIGLRDPALADHQQRTAEVACAIGAELGADMDTLDLIYTAAYLHDIGKLAVSEAILWKPAGLTRSEWRQMRAHPVEGHRLVADVVPHDVCCAVLCHHERMDGEGYPRRLNGRTLPMVAKIVAVADAFDAITSDRPFRRALPIAVAVEEVLRCAGSQFDAEAAAALAVLFDGRSEARPPCERLYQPAPGEAASFDLDQIPALVRLRGRPA